jgi:hypothetical protein
MPDDRVSWSFVVLLIVAETVFVALLWGAGVAV